MHLIFDGDFYILVHPNEYNMYSEDSKKNHGTIGIYETYDQRLELRYSR
jgi:hypothetical protein